MIPLHYKLGALAIGFVIAFGTGYSQGVKKYDRFKAKVDALGAQQAEKTAQANKKAAKTNEDIRNAYDASLRAVLADRERLRSRSGRCTVPGTPASAPGAAQDAAGDGTVDPAVYVETGVMLHYLQQWAREQGMMR